MKEEVSRQLTAGSRFSGRTRTLTEPAATRPSAGPLQYVEAVAGERLAQMVG
jgi:hypothetical protein